MAPEPSTLELLRSRLADLEARQRAAGGASEPEFWERFAGRMPSLSSKPDTPSATDTWTTPDALSAPAGKGRRRTRRVAPESRPVTVAQGPWSELSAESLDSLDLRR